MIPKTQDLTLSFESEDRLLPDQHENYNFKVNKEGMGTILHAIRGITTTPTVTIKEAHAL